MGLRRGGKVDRRSAAFADVNYGGRAEAFRVAVEYRDQMFACVGQRVDVGLKAASNQPSVTGLLGVVPGYVTPSSGPRYVGRWYALHGITKTEYSVLQLGMRGAFLAAVRRRRNAVGQPFVLSDLKAAIRRVDALPAAPEREAPRGRFARGTGWVAGV